MTTTIDIPTPVVRAVSLRVISARRWRVIDKRGLVIGHLRAEAVPEGIRYHAERFDISAARLRLLGSFWTPHEAVECLRYLH